MDATVLHRARELVERLSHVSAEAFGGAATVSFDPELPGLVNDPEITAVCLQAARAVVGERHVVTAGRPSMGAEDFADYLSMVPACMVRRGVARRGKKKTLLHTSKFDIDESALIVGVRLLTRVLLHWPVARMT